MITVTTVVTALLAAQVTAAPLVAADANVPVAAVPPTAPASPATRSDSTIAATTLPPASVAPSIQPTLMAGTPVFVVLDQDLTTTTSRVGDRFQVTVMHDVVDGDTIVIPQGTIGRGEVTFVTKRGGFGKGGIIGIALRDLELDGRKVALDGHYREEGRNRSGATAATFFAAGVFAGFIKGNESGIPKGRELRARTGEGIAYTSGASPLVKTRETTLSAGDARLVAAAPTSSITTSTHQ